MNPKTDNPSAPNTRGTSGTVADAPRHQFLWLDVETTGLEPRKDTILEIACALVADDRDGDFEIVDAFERVMRCEVDGGNRRVRPALGTWIDVPARVWEMHGNNGLWEDVQAPGAVSLALADAELKEWLTQRGATRDVQLAGNSVHFDLGFLRVHFPQVAKMLHHRVFDVSTLLAAAGLWADPVERVWPDVHRALADVVASVEMAAACRRSLTARWHLGGGK